MRTITPALEAILRQRFQVAGDQYSGRVEIDSILDAASPAAIDLEAILETGLARWFDGNHTTWQPVLGHHAEVFGFTEPVTFGSFHIFWHYGGLYTQVGDPGSASGAAGSFTLQGGPTSAGPWTMVLEDADPVGTAGVTYPDDFDNVYTLDAPVTYRYWLFSSTTSGNNDIYEVEGATPATEASYLATSYRPKRITLNQNRRMGPDQASIEFSNEGLPFGWGPTSIIPTNSRIRCYQWFGDVANEVLTFTGVVDKITDSRDVLTTTLECRSLAGPILVDQTFSTTAPQAAGEAGAARTEANGVYLNREVDYIIGDRLDRAGWPSGDTDVADTSFVLDEFIVDDGATEWDTLARLCAFVAFDLWDDSDGVIHARPLGDSASVDATLTPDYAYEIGIA